MAHYITGQYDRAIADYTEAIRINPNDATAYNNRGVAYEKKGDKTKAEKDFARVKQLGSEPKRNGTTDDR